MSTGTMMVHRFLVSGALVVGVLVVSACGDDGPNATTMDATPGIVVTGTDQLTFEPDAFEMPAGAANTIGLASGSGVEHDFVVADAADVGAVRGEDQDDADVEAGDLYVAQSDAGQTTNATLTIDEPGTYQVYCSVPGHREAGMTATLTVTDAE